MMLKPLHKEAEAHCRRWQARLRRQLPLLAPGVFAELEDALLQRLMALPEGEQHPEDDRRDVADFITGQRQYEACILGLKQWLLPQADLGVLSEAQRPLVQDKLLRDLDWTALAQRHGLRGRRESEARLRKAIEGLQNTLQ